MSAIRARLILIVAIIIAAISVVSLAIGFVVTPQPPRINGTIIPQGYPLQGFSLVDHHNKLFTNNDLLGNWHVLSYGYTHCPDICPTTLATVARVAQRLDQMESPSATRFLFYSVDFQRDTPGHLAKYLPWFNKDLIGLTHNNSTTNHLPFEDSLGMVYSLDSRINSEQSSQQALNKYYVNHGVLLYVLNPQGKLQAILKPGLSTNGAEFFVAEDILRDYRKIREFASKSNNQGYWAALR